MKVRFMMKYVLGFLAIFLGFIGILIPVLPTTPFLLIAIACFSTAPKIQKFILKVPLFKEYYDSYTNGSGLRKRTVIINLIFLWTMLIISMIVVNLLWLSIILGLIGIAVTMHILWISKERSKRREERRKKVYGS